MCRRVLTRNRSKNADKETGASRSDKVASIGYVVLKRYLSLMITILPIPGTRNRTASKRVCYKRL